MSKLHDVQYDCPRSYESEYTDIIAMMEMSVDATVNLDMQSFKSYVLNEWSWSRGFAATTTLYKSYNNS